MPFKKLPLLLFTTALASIPATSSAACSRDDVQFYLDKGFSTDQITTLCKTPSSQSKAEDSSSITNKESKASTTAVTNITKENDAELFFREAIKGRNISLTNESLIYTLKVCITYGEEDNYGFAPKTCPNVKFNVALKGLEVLEPVQKLFFKPDSIEVKGKITRDIINGLDKHKLKDQILIHQSLESGNTTAIPVRDDISIKQVFKTLEKLTF